MNHECCLDNGFIPPNIPPHNKCTKSELDDEVYYTLYWGYRFVCIIRKNGPVTIMDYRQEPDQIDLYQNMEEAMKPLVEKLGTI